MQEEVKQPQWILQGFGLRGTWSCDPLLLRLGRGKGLVPCQGRSGLDCGSLEGVLDGGGEAEKQAQLPVLKLSPSLAGGCPGCL